MSNFDHPAFASYQLLDSGNAEKLERFGDFVLRRPDPQALWRPTLENKAWDQADYKFVRESDRGGKWITSSRAPKSWNIEVNGASLKISPTPFKHVGLFPEQASNWQWVAEQRSKMRDTHEPKLLNLFAYTGAASIFAAKDDWQVTHVDAARPSLDWASQNAAQSKIADNGIRWMFDDCLKFAQREARRGNKYQGILLDPPHYGRGPKGEKWQFEQHIAPLLDACKQLLAPTPHSFLIISTYAIGYSPLAFENMLRDFGDGKVESGELWLPQKDSERRLPCGFCARFSR
ncbi:MAG: class I SAM-dependent methyltransferase [Planctomycetota bacterium]|jgi:23S rRNA (cytosine1962-C5)-methyltransferase|nr:class I SAM-dependent methyltransferase [Planctomycetota bacterium]